MRNPFYIEVNIPKGESMFTEWTSKKKQGFNLGKSIAIQAFDDQTTVD
jgi:hypothetical protein